MIFFNEKRKTIVFEKNLHMNLSFMRQLFFIERNNPNVFWPRIIRPKNVFSLNISLMIGNEVLSFTVVYKKPTFFKKNVLFKDDRFVFGFFFIVFKTKQSFFIKVKTIPPLCIMIYTICKCKGLSSNIFS